MRTKRLSTVSGAAGLFAACVVGCFGDDSTPPVKALPDASIGLPDGAPGADAGTEGGAPPDAAGGDDGSPGDDGAASDATADGDTGTDGPATEDGGGCAGDGGPGTFSCTGSLSAPRIAPGGAVLSSGKVLVAGGWNATDKTLATAEVYDPATGTFAPTGAMRAEHLWAGWTAPWPVLPSGKVLVAGGLAGSGALLAGAELYDPAAGTFGDTPPLVTSVVAFGPVTLQDGSALFVGGYSSVVLAPPTPSFQYTAGTNQAQRYDPTAGMMTGGFAAAGTLAEARLFGCNVRLASGKVLAIGGWQGLPTAFEANIEQYDPATNMWTTIGTMPNGSTCNANAFLLPSGKILLDTSSLLDPATLTVTPTTNKVAATSAMFAQLANGDVLAVGGTTGTSNAATAGAQVYRDATGTWDDVGPLHQPRAGGRVFLLPSGQALVVGGADATGAALATAEVYHP